MQGFNWSGATIDSLNYSSFMFELLYTAASVLRCFQVEGIHSTWKERKKTGGEYSSRHAAGHRHVVVCTSNLSAEYTMDFLIEFYANRKLEVLAARFKKKSIFVVIYFVLSSKLNLICLICKPSWKGNFKIFSKGNLFKDLLLELHMYKVCQKKNLYF